MSRERTDDDGSTHESDGTGDVVYAQDGGDGGEESTQRPVASTPSPSSAAAVSSATVSSPCWGSVGSSEGVGFGGAGRLCFAGVLRLVLAGLPGFVDFLSPFALR